MKLRYRLMLAFFLLAVLPLAAITIYSYETSSRAFRDAVAAESGQMAEMMEERMGRVTDDLNRRIERLEVIPPPETQGAPPGYVSRLLTALGESAVFVESVEITSSDKGAPAHPGTHPGLLPMVIELPRILEVLGDHEDEGTGEENAPASAEQAQVVVRKIGEQIGKEAAEVMKAIEAGLRERDRGMRRRAGAEQARQLHLEREFGCDLRQGDRTVGHLKAQVSSNRLLAEVLGRTPVEKGEIPFAVDAKGTLYTPDPADLPQLQRIYPTPSPDWMVVTRGDASRGVMFGLAHPTGESLREIGRTSLRNLFCGLGMALLALLGILPLSHRMTRNLTEVSRGADQLAAGDLDVQVPVRSHDEFGHLARAFNEMAGRLKENQGRLLEQERLRKELEMCRTIQSELLPRAPLHYPFAEVQGVSIPARELGGDFFNYFDLPGGEIALLMGDVSGKGVPAALLMANLQATLRARLPIERDLAAFADRLDREVEATTAVQVYLTLFLSVLDPKRRELRYVNGGHQSPYLVRRDGRLERLSPTGRPIGLLSGGTYEERRVPLERGDCIFLYTDGLVDAESPDGSPFGIERLEAVFSRDVGGSADSLLARVEAVVRAHRGGMEAPDDAALLVLRIGDWPGEARA